MEWPGEARIQAQERQVASIRYPDISAYDFAVYGCPERRYGMSPLTIILIWLTVFLALSMWWGVG